MKDDLMHKNLPDPEDGVQQPTWSFRITPEIPPALDHIIAQPGFPKRKGGRKGLRSCAIKYAILHFMDGRRAIKLEEADELIKTISQNRGPLQNSLNDITAFNTELNAIGKNLNMVVERLMTINKMIENGGDGQLLSDFTKVAKTLTDFQADIDSLGERVIAAHDNARQSVLNVVMRENEILRRALI